MITPGEFHQGVFSKTQRFWLLQNLKYNCNPIFLVILIIGQLLNHSKERNSVNIKKMNGKQLKGRRQERPPGFLAIFESVQKIAEFWHVGFVLP